MAREPVSAHLQVPLRLTTVGSFVTVEQDSDADLEQSVRLVLSSRPGDRWRDAPDYGSPEPMPGPVDVASMAAAVAQFEPRAKVTITPLPVSEDGGQRIRVVVAPALETTP